jgi:hypothetical protein
MDPTQGDCEFVAHLSAKCSRLSEAKVMSIGSFSSAHETRLLGDEAEMFFIAVPTRLSNRKGAFVDTFNFGLSGRS